jgi:cyclophilin family peptidyl-prolyl cis-trans isomerase
LGKIKKIKEERKKARFEAKIKKKRLINNSFKYSVLFLLLAILGTGGFFGYKWLDNKYNINERFGGIFQKAQDEPSNQEEKKVTRKKYDQAPEMQIDVNKEYVANFETNKGNFKVRLYTKDAPKTVNNLVFLSREGFYDGLTFHRVIKDFMIQGGDPNGDGTGDPGYKFEDEINERKLVKGVLAMANSGPDTNGSQFFIVTAEATDWLDGKHTAFGEVIEGLDVVMAIQEVETTEGDKPVDAVTLNKVTISES